MEALLQKLCLQDIDDESDEEDNLEPLTGKELQLMNVIKNLIKRRRYKDIPKLFTSGRHAASNVEILPKMSMHVCKEVCMKYLTEEVCEKNERLFACAEELLKRIATVAPPEDFLFEMLQLLDPTSPESVFVTVMGVLGSPMLRLEETDNIMSVDVFKECLDEIGLRRDLYMGIPTYLLIGESVNFDDRIDSDEDLQYIVMFHVRLGAFYFPLVKEICDKPRPESEIFRSFKSNKRNILCSFLLKMLEKPLGLFDLSVSHSSMGGKCPVFFAVSLTTAITKCIGNPFFFLNFMEEKERWDKPRLDMDELDSDDLLKDLLRDAEGLLIYYYMVIVEGAFLAQVPKVYNPLYVCEMGLYLVHKVLSVNPIPTLQEKALLLATKLITNLGPIKLSSSHLEDLYIFRVFLNDIRKLALSSITANVLLLTVEALKQFILYCMDDVKYMILKNLMGNVNHAGFGGFLTAVYKDLAGLNLKKVLSDNTPLSPIYMGQHLRTIFLENICILPQGVKTDPAANYDLLEAALEAIAMFAKTDTKNITGFWNFINEIQSQFTTPLKKSLHFYEGRFKTELLNIRPARGLSGKRGRTAHKLHHPIERSQHIEKLKNCLSEISKLRFMLTGVCEMLKHFPLLQGDKNNNDSNLVKTK